jgi:hypothetical protein
VLASAALAAPHEARESPIMGRRNGRTRES